MNARFLISARKFEVGNVVNALLSLVVKGYAMHRPADTVRSLQALGLGIPLRR